ncbi:MAG: hypothetical protein N4A45_06795 [Flavobacteriales bacterium]|jgi:hypothetical protein|nr:hypothetical protein [Flavobacteriales bacterium]
MKSNIKITFCLLFMLMINEETYSQIGIGTITPHASSILDISSTDKGVLIPRINSHTDVSSPAEGLIIYDLSDNCVNVYNNSSWINLCNTGSGGGNSGGGNSGGGGVSFSPEPISLSKAILKPLYDLGSNSHPSNRYGRGIDYSGDGTTLAVLSGRTQFAATNYGGGVHIYTNNNGYFVEDTLINTHPETYSNMQSVYMEKGVAISENGNVLAIGVGVDATGANPNYSAVQIFERTGTLWEYKSSLIISFQNFGGGQKTLRISDDGNRIFVGSQSSTENKVLIYDRNGINWDLTTIQNDENITGIIESNRTFGYAIGITNDGTKLAVLGVGGAASPVENKLGKVAIYELNTATGNWDYKATLDDGISTPNQFQWRTDPFSVSFSGDGSVLAVSFVDFDGYYGTGHIGRVSIYRENASNLTTGYDLEQTIIRSDIYTDLSIPEVVEDSRFGRDVTLSNDGSTLFVGLRHKDPDDRGLYNCGSILKFDYDNTNTTWSLSKTLEAVNKNKNNDFGEIIRIDHNNSHIFTTDIQDISYYFNAASSSNERSGGVHQF